MAAPDGIATELLKDLEPSFVASVRNGSSEASGILMQAHTLEFQVLPINEESFVSIKYALTDPKITHIFIKGPST